MKFNHVLQMSTKVLLLLGLYTVHIDESAVVSRLEGKNPIQPDRRMCKVKDAAELPHKQSQSDAILKSIPRAELGTADARVRLRADY